MLYVSAISRSPAHPRTDGSDGPESRRALLEIEVHGAAKWTGICPWDVGGSDRCVGAVTGHVKSRMCKVKNPGAPSYATSQPKSKSSRVAYAKFM